MLPTITSYSALEIGLYLFYRKKVIAKLKKKKQNDWSPYSFTGKLRSNDDLSGKSQP